MQTVKFTAGDTILSEGEAGDTAFLIVTGSVEVSIGEGAKAKSVGTLDAGDVFGEMSLIDPGPRSATVRAVTPTECLVTTYEEFISSAEADP
jgi:CRP-like cAMP-binding protein